MPGLVAHVLNFVQIVIDPHGVWPYGRFTEIGQSTTRLQMI